MYALIRQYTAMNGHVAEQKTVTPDAFVQIRYGDVHGHETRRAVAMLTRVALCNPQKARREIAAQERQIARRGPADLPFEPRAVGPDAPARYRPIVTKAARVGCFDGLGDGVGQQREIDETFAGALLFVPPAVFARVLQKSDQFDITAVGEDRIRRPCYALTSRLSSQRVNSEIG